MGLSLVDMTEPRSFGIVRDGRGIGLMSWSGREPRLVLLGDKQHGGGRERYLTITELECALEEFDVRTGRQRRVAEFQDAMRIIVVSAFVIGVVVGWAVFH